MSQFQVSVIIPVYNAERFVEKAIKSALEQPEVAEVVVVNDGSTDDSLKQIQGIQNRDNRVKLFHHANNENKGRAASRNLGIKEARSKYIAFLDADDFYLEHRFTNDVKVFLENKDADGVYNAIGVKFYRKFLTDEQKKLQLVTVKKVVEPKNLFDVLISGNLGSFSIDGLTVKTSVFSKVGLFVESLTVAEDTDLIWKMSLICKLYPGELTQPLAKRGVHETNVFNNTAIYEKHEIKLYESLYYWSVKQGLNIKIIERFLERIWILKLRQSRNVFKHFVYYLKINLKTPKLFFTYSGIKYFPFFKFVSKKICLYKTM